MTTLARVSLEALREVSTLLGRPLPNPWEPGGMHDPSLLPARLREPEAHAGWPVLAGDRTHAFDYGSVDLLPVREDDGRRRGGPAGGGRGSCGCVGARWTRSCETCTASTCSIGLSRSLETQANGSCALPLCHPATLDALGLTPDALVELCDDAAAFVHAVVSAAAVDGRS